MCVSIGKSGIGKLFCMLTQYEIAKDNITAIELVLYWGSDIVTHFRR